MCERMRFSDRSWFALSASTPAGQQEETRMKKIALMVAGALALGAGLAAAPDKAQAGGFGFSVGFGAPAFAPYYYRPYPVFYRPYPVVRRVVVVTRPAFVYRPRVVTRVVYRRPVYYRTASYKPRPYFARRVVYRTAFYRPRPYVARQVVYVDGFWLSGSHRRWRPRYYSGFPGWCPAFGGWN